MNGSQHQQLGSTTNSLNKNLSSTNYASNTAKLKSTNNLQNLLNSSNGSPNFRKQLAAKTNNVPNQTSIF